MNEKSKILEPLESFSKEDEIGKFSKHENSSSSTNQ